MQNISCPGIAKTAGLWHEMKKGTMNNILVYCNTYYQLLVAIQLRLTVKKADCISVIITDQSRGAEAVAERLRGTDFFHAVFFLKTKVAAEEVNARYKMRSSGCCRRTCPRTIFAMN